MTSTIFGHPLDNVLWNALATSQSHLALGGVQARRFRPEFALFAAMPTLSGAGFEELAGVMQAGDVVAMAAPDDIEPGALFDVVDRKNLVQMIGPATGAARDVSGVVELGGDDVAGMTALTQLTAPGPWFSRTHDLGRFLGFKADGHVVAMAGERLRVPGHTEISAVCCHPDFRGRSLAADLMRWVMKGILARGDVPFLHVLAENASAIALYEKLGFRFRQQRRLTVLRRSRAPHSDSSRT